MSISNLLVPNNYNIYANSVTTSSGIIRSGTYFPIITPGVNMWPSIVVQQGYYYQIENIVTATFYFTYNPVNINTSSGCNITLPIDRSSDFTSVYQSMGTIGQVYQTMSTIGQVRSAPGTQFVTLILMEVSSIATPIQVDVTFSYILEDF